MPVVVVVDVVVVVVVVAVVAAVAVVAVVDIFILFFFWINVLLFNSIVPAHQHFDRQIWHRASGSS